MLPLYHSSPYPFKVLLASIHGYRLRWWRYGKDTEHFVLEAHEREHWTSEQWKNWREERLAYMLHNAATHVPYYRDTWQKIRRNNPSLSWNYLENWPLLEKDTVRNNPRSFVSDTSRYKPLFVDHTGGTTGKPTLIYQGREAVVKWYAILDARLRRWYNLVYSQRWGMFGGQKVVALDQKSPPYWVRNHGLNQLYFSVFHITQHSAKDYVAALKGFRPSYLVVYPSILGTLSHHILKQGLNPPEINAIFCNSEKVLDTHRKLMHTAFNCPIVDTYGMAEMTSAASECQFGVMHEWPEIGFLELYNRQANSFIHSQDQLGEFVMTGLINEDMPLIRYVNGDLGFLPDTSYKCACGRLLPKFGKIQGRANDLIQTRDGKSLYILDTLFNHLPIVEAQLVQEKIDEIRIILVRDNSYTEKDSQHISNRLYAYLGDVKITFDFVDKVPREKNGKFRPFVSHLSC